MSIKEYLGLMGRPPVPAGGGDAWGQGIASGVQAFLASQPTLADQQKMRMERDFYDARTGLVREQTRAAQTEAALKALGLQTEQKKQSALQDYIQRHVAVDRQEAPGFVGPADPSLTRPTTWEGVLAGMKPDDLTQMNILAEAMRPQPDDSRMRTLAVAGGKPVGVEQAVSSAELNRAQEIKQRQQDMQLQGDLARAQATERAAQIRGPAQGAREQFQIKEVPDGNGGTTLVRVPMSGGDATPIMMGGQPVAGKAIPEKPMTATYKKDIEGTAESLMRMERFMTRFQDDFAGKGAAALGSIQNTIGNNWGMGYEEQGGFWQEYQAWSNATMSAISGLNVTEGEYDRFKRATIHPGMTPQAARSSLAVQHEILNDVLARNSKAATSAGFKNQTLDLNGGTLPIEGAPRPIKGYENYQKKPTPTQPSGGMTEAEINISLRNARARITAGGDPEIIKKRLADAGIDPGRL